MFKEIAFLLVTTLGTLYLLFVLGRFLLQLARADFYNPISQSMVKATTPLLNPLRKIIPGFGGVDVACLVLAVMLNWAFTLVLYAISYGTMPPLGPTFIWSLLGTFAFLVNIIFWAMIIVVVVSWISMAAPVSNPIVDLVHQLVRPFLRPFQRIMPDTGGLDFSPILLIMSIYIVEIVIRHIGASIGVNQVVQKLVLGL